MKTDTKTFKLALAIVCALLAVALIIVSAFAYQWKNDIKELKKSNQTYRALADTNTIESISTELSNATMLNQQYEAEIKSLNTKIEEYTTILEENGLLPE